MKNLLTSSILIVCTLLFSLQGVHADFLENEEYVYLNNVDEPVTVQDIQNELTVFDDLDGDLTDEIYIIVDNYTSNKNILGDFIVVFGVTDSGGNESTAAITVRNVDVTAPVISIVSYISLSIPQFSNINLNLPVIKAIDGYEGDISNNFIINGISDVDTSTLGEHVLIYSITDSSGNTASEEITISIVDVTFPVIIGVDTIYKKDTYIMSTYDVLEYFTASDDIDGDLSSSLVIESNEYIGNADKVGTYSMIISVTDSSGNKATHELIIKVRDNIIPLLIIDKYSWIVVDSYKLTGVDFINTLKSIGDLPNDTYVQSITYDTYSDNYDQLSNSQFNFFLLASSGNEYSREIDLTVIVGIYATVTEEASIFSKVGTHLWDWGWLYAVGTIFIIGFFKGKK